MDRKHARTWLALAAATALGTLAVGAQAAGTVTSRIAEIETLTVSPYVTVQFVDNIGGSRPACATSPNKMVFDATTTAGKNTMSVLTAAQLSGKRVEVFGYNSCGIVSTMETLLAVRLRND